MIFGNNSSRFTGARESGLLETRINAQDFYARRAVLSGRHPEISRLETKFGVRIVGVMEKRAHSTLLRCADGSTMITNISKEAIKSMEMKIKKVAESHPLLQNQWIVFEGNARASVYQEFDGRYWCNCSGQGRRGDCRHIQRILDGIIDGEYFPFPEKSEIVAFRRVTQPALKSIPSKNVSAFDRWVGGEYPVVPALEEAFWKVENTDKLAKCVICGRILTNPVSVAIEIGPECRQRISNAEYIVDDGSALKVTKALREASTLYHEKKYRDWIIRAVLTQGAPLPMKVLRSPWNGKKQYWGYKNKPLLYYLDIDNQLHYVDVCRRQLRYRAVTKETALTELDSRALACLSDSTL
jgi:hypothetical protein